MTFWILVPFRDSGNLDRLHQLSVFVRYCTREFPQLIERFHQNVEIIIIEQTPGLQFNRGLLLNCGMHLISRFVNDSTDVICFHDVDLLPKNTLRAYSMCLYNSKRVVHLAWAWSKYRYPTYVGGITSMPFAMARVCNGFPNLMFGWGGEDDILYNRLCQSKCIRDYNDLVRPPVGTFEIEDLESDIHLKSVSLDTDTNKCADKDWKRSKIREYKRNHADGLSCVESKFLVIALRRFQKPRQFKFKSTQLQLGFSMFTVQFV